MQWKSVHEKWTSYQQLDPEVKELLGSITDEVELEDCFYKNLEFGTGGMRGLLGAGTNRMNVYTVRKAALGLGRYIEENGEEAKARGVVIAYDSRHKSEQFALETAKTLGNLGINVYVFESLRTTPELSFAVRYLHAFSGVVITASHNPSTYNGFKVYGQDGAQFASRDADVIVKNVNDIENELTIPVADAEELKENGLLTIIGEQVDKVYLQKLQSLIVNQSIIDEMADNFKIVYTPLHGTGNRPVMQALKDAGFKHVSIVNEQALPDGNFPTVDYPNPEEASAFQLAIEYGERENADLLIATDPDADRVGVAVLVDGQYKLLTGNQIGAILLHYLITQKQANGTLQENATVLKTIVTSELGRDIAMAHGLETIDTLTGFKYIAEQMRDFAATGERSYLFGYEESYGYLIGDFVRDKDAVQTCLLLAEVAAFYKKKQMTLYDGLLAIFKEYGFYLEGLHSITLEGRDGSEKIAAIMEDFREHPPTQLAHIDIAIREDYEVRERVHVKEKQTEVITLPQSNVLKYILANDAWVCIRPSGTEPKIKFYFGVKESSEEEGRQLLQRLEDAVMERIQSTVS